MFIYGIHGCMISAQGTMRLHGNIRMYSRAFYTRVEEATEDSGGRRLTGKKSRKQPGQGESEENYCAGSVQRRGTRGRNGTTRGSGHLSRRCGREKMLLGTARFCVVNKNLSV